MKKMIAALAVLMISVAGFVMSAASADPKEKVGVCHRTASDTNPYVYLDVPEDEANGHITGDSKQHNENVVWKTDGVWRGVPHVAGDVKVDYLASDRGVCEDITTTPTDDPTPEPPVITEPPVTPPVVTLGPAPKKKPKEKVVIPTVVNAGL